MLDARDIDEAADDHAIVVDENVFAVAAVREVDVGDDFVAQEKPMQASQSSVIVDAGDIAVRVHRAEAGLAVVCVQDREAAVSVPQHPMNETRAPVDAFTTPMRSLGIVAAGDVLAPVGREPGIRRGETRAGEDLKVPSLRRIQPYS